MICEKCGHVIAHCSDNVMTAVLSYNVWDDDAYVNKMAQLRVCVKRF